MNQIKYKIFETIFGLCSIVFKDSGEKVKIIRVFVPPEDGIIWDVLKTSFPDAREEDEQSINVLILRVQDYLAGRRVEFSLNMIDVSTCKPFQLLVLNLARQVPFGRVASYGWIAKQMQKKCYQAVGAALSTNPFPLIFPCERITASNRHMGGYQGGGTMKRRMLEMQEVTFDPNGKVAVENFLG